LELRGDLERVARGEDVQPFYMSRSSQLRPQAGEDDSIGDAQPPPGKLLGRSGLIACALVASLVSLGVIAYKAAHRQSPKSAGPVKAIKVESRPVMVEVLDHPVVFAPGSNDAKAREIFAKCGSIRSKIVEIDGTKRRRFVFPAWSIGKVVWGPGKVDACGVVDVPADTPLTLEIGFKRSLEVLSNPQVFDKIAPDEFDNLLILGAGMGGDEAGTVMPQVQPNYIVQVLKKASPWSRLQYVSLNEISVTKEVLDVLNDCKHLRFLTIFRPPEMNSRDLASQPFLGRLLKLALYGVKDVQQVCDRLSSSSELGALLLDDCGTPAEALLQLRTCPKLYLLELHETNVDRLVPALTQLTSLSEIRFMKTALKPYQIKMITTCRNIHHLYLDRKVYSPEEISRCNHREPKVIFEG
jgi:hypothetical protein